MEIDEMLDSILFAIDELPEELIAKYMSLRLKQALTDMRRQHRMARRTGRGTETCPESIEVKKCALEVLLRDGVRKPFSVHRIQPNWAP